MSEPGNSQQGGNGGGCILTIIIAIVVIVVSMTSNHTGQATVTPAGHSSSGAASAKVPASPTFGHTPQPMPKNGQVTMKSKASQTIDLRISTPKNHYYLLAFLSKADGKTVMMVFLYPESSVDVKAPVGTFCVQYARGTLWYGEELRFGPETLYGQFTEDFIFEPNYRYDLRLIGQVNGNLHDRAIDEVQFGG